MSGHSKWANIKHKKEASDKKKGQVFSRLAKEIMVAVKQGGKDPSSNIKLRMALTSAKAGNMPRENIERAIKKGAGELGDVAYEEITYEGFGPAGTAFVIECLTENRNRTIGDVRTTLDRNGGSLASSGSVVRLFSRCAHFMIEGEFADEDKLMELTLDAGAEDISAEDGVAEIWAAPEAFNDIAKVLEDAGITCTEAGITRRPETTVGINELNKAQQVLRLSERLNELDDVQAVYSNENIASEVLEEIDAQDN